MPVQDFSYETDVAPYAASRFFTGIQANTNLSPQARERLQTGFFQDATGIEAQRMKFAQERNQSALQQASLAHTESALEESRMRRQRIANAEANDAAVTQQLNSIVYSGDDPEVRKQKVADLALQHAGSFEYNPSLGHRFNLAEKAIPDPKKPMFTPEQQIELYSKLPPEVAASGDPVRIGIALKQAEKDAEDHKVAKATLAKNDEASARLRHDLLFTEPKFYDDTATEEKDKWLDPTVHNKFKLLMATHATPEEQKAFNAEQDDHKRAALAVKVQDRSIRSTYGPLLAPPAAPVKKRVDGRSLVR